MNFNIKRAAVVGAVSLALVAANAVSAHAAEGDPINPQPAGSVAEGSKGGFFLYDAEFLPVPNDSSRVFTRSEDVYAAASPTDYLAEINAPNQDGVRPVTGTESFTGVYRFLAEKTAADVVGGTNTWNAFAVDSAAGPNGGTLMPYMVLDSINGGPGGIADDIAAGGTYWYGVAYTINNGVTVVGATYREITIQAGTGNYTVAPMVLEGPAAIATTTTLTSSATSAFTGDTVDLTATVAAADSTAVAGNVTFYNGEASIGTQAVAAGSATITTSALTEGTHNFRAVFTPSDAAYNGSEGTFTVTVSSAAAPAAALDATNSNGVTGSADAKTNTVTLNTTTTESSVNVWAHNGTEYVSLGEHAVTGGVVTASYQGLGLEGDINFVLANKAGDVLGWATINVPAGQSASADLIANVQGNGDFILVDRTKKANELTLGQLVNGKSQSTGTLGEVEVIDQRYLTLEGWTLTTNVNEFVHSNGTDTIPASALGLKQTLVSQAPAAVDAPNWAAATFGAEQTAGGAVYASTFAEAAAGTYSESTVMDADLTFVAPEGAKKGKYGSTLTLTLVSK
ncbi:Ig-like domain-containing protein [Tessaracoccus sp. OS52]|uniref:Ig-like domain-containing protein n=1 Tax=Tessaracoccus sp. OS52 TaxID=2886691 RepID=UPI001D11DCC1|nr:Ig-like domain-containing protein [Tessaracoccus sp. OS52]MCC2594183.1 Ig-like domain-containing protein [Tessaracoccus sp. OS52]